MRTFQEIAEYARTVEPSQRLGGINYCDMIAELAEAMHRLEYNLAVQMAHLNLRVPIDQLMREAIVDGWLNNLRAELP